MSTNKTEYLVDDTPVDLSVYDKYTDEELERLYQERFGEISED